MTPRLLAFLEACAGGDVASMSRLLGEEPDLIRGRGETGGTGLHAAVAHPEAVRLLLRHGADPNARDVGDNAIPLHWAAGYGATESVRALLEGGSDVQGSGDLHLLDAIGWATCFDAPRRDVVALLLEHGARHHVFSAIAVADRDALRDLVRRDPEAIHRRLSEHEQEQSALHYVCAPPDGLVGGAFRTGDHLRTLELLIELGADLEATDAKGRTPLEVVMLRGDERAMTILHAAGARAPGTTGTAASASRPSPGEADGRLTPMLSVPDLDATIAWYRAIGFRLNGSHVDGGRTTWASVSLGGAAIMFVRSSDPRPAVSPGTSLWIHTDSLDELYAHFRERQLEWARAKLAGGVSDPPAVPFAVDLYTAFYGQREFGIRDPNGVELMFAQAIDAG